MSNYLVIGQGSMGKRRVRCLIANQIPAQQILVFDTRIDRLSESAQKYGVKAVDSIDAVLNDSATQAVFVSVPGALHLQYCLAAARAGKHWFCEVPLATSLEGLEELFDLTRPSLVGAAGCQVLFHPLARALRSWSRVLWGTRTTSDTRFWSNLPYLRSSSILPSSRMGIQAISSGRSKYNT